MVLVDIGNAKTDSWQRASLTNNEAQTRAYKKLLIDKVEKQERRIAQRYASLLDIFKLI